MTEKGLWWLSTVTIAVVAVSLDEGYGLKICHGRHTTESGFFRRVTYITGTNIERTTKETRNEIKKYLNEAVLDLDYGAKNFIAEVPISWVGKSYEEKEERIALRSFWRKSGEKKEQNILALVHYRYMQDMREVMKTTNTAICKILETEPETGEIFVVFPRDWEKDAIPGLSVGLYVTESPLALGTINLEREIITVKFLKNGKQEQDKIRFSGSMHEATLMPPKCEGLIKQVMDFCHSIEDDTAHEVEYEGESLIPRKWEYEGLKARYEEEVDAVGPLGDLVCYLLERMCITIVTNANLEHYAFPITVVLGPLEIDVPDRSSLE